MEVKKVNETGDLDELSLGILPSEWLDYSDFVNELLEDDNLISIDSKCFVVQCGDDGEIYLYELRDFLLEQPPVFELGKDIELELPDNTVIRQ